MSPGTRSGKAELRENATVNKGEVGGDKTGPSLECEEVLLNVRMSLHAIQSP